ncbi:MAG: beta-galactosidase, partial [Phycisphaerae bacterium]|nr:beta-galactosidase [Phycisphaerae bacterium]
MATVGYDNRSYFLDGRRLWLASGSIHYFRVPHQLWRDRLLKAKRAGLNCVQTCVAWNFHEPKEGQWDFSGDKDLREFIIQAGELGLYVILRPGPYICAEWDFGGLPSWLVTKSGITYRAANAAYLHFLGKYLGKVLPRLADLQVTRGGNIILIQNENEYYTTTMPDRLNYCKFISQLIRRAGFDIPIITCNNLTQPMVPDAIECFNGYKGSVQFLKRLRVAQPDAPMLATEFRPGGGDYWGGPHQTKDARESARLALEILGCGCQINYYMWHGGTNFAFWGSRLDSAESAWQTASYDYDAPLAEGGGLTEKYHLTKLVNMLANHFGQVIAQMRMEGPGVTVHDSTQVLNLSGPSGRLAVITNNGRDKVTSASISLPNGKEMEVSLLPLGAVAVPVMVRLTPDRLLNYANLMPLGLFGADNLVLHGPAGWEGRICINDQEIRHEVPEGDKPLILEHSGQKIIIINSDLAQRAWELDGSLVLGPKFVGETTDDIIPTSGMKQYSVISSDGQVTQKKVKQVSTRGPTPPRLGAFERVCVCEEPIKNKLEWEKL